MTEPMCAWLSTNLHCTVGDGLFLDTMGNTDGAVAQAGSHKCGHVAARGCAAMHAAGDDWSTINLNRAVECACIGRDLTDLEVFSHLRAGVGQCGRDTSLYGVGAFDQAINRIASAAHGVAEGGPPIIAPRFFVSNTDAITSRGVHWFAIAYVVRRYARTVN